MRVNKKEKEQQTGTMCDNSTHGPADIAMEWIGTAGGFILGVCLIPQIAQSVRLKSTTDLAYSWQIAYFVGLSCIVIYAGWEGLWPIYAPATVELLSIIILVSLKIKYDGCGKEAWASRTPLPPAKRAVAQVEMADIENMSTTPTVPTVADTTAATAESATDEAGVEEGGGKQKQTN